MPLPPHWDPTMIEDDALKALGPLLDAFAALGIRSYVGGSLASSAHGVPRSTLDIDLVADIRKEHASKLAGMLAGAYYVEPEMILDAVSRTSSFNVIHLETMFKVDVFVLKNTRYAKRQFARREKMVFRADPEFTADLCSPEDVILSKLDWYKQGWEVSERQWSDLIGVMKVKGDTLDLEYLHKWADELGLLGLLTRALQETSQSRK